MPIYEVTQTELCPIPTTRFAEAGLTERRDLQRLLRSQIEVISPGTLVIDEEFGEWEDSRRRIDLLGVDKQANLVVVELKRTEDGGHMELQAIRYAAMVSTMTFNDAVETYASYLTARGENIDAQQALLNHLEWEEPEEDRFAQDVRIVLASADFSREITSAVLWLNERSLDIKCVRLQLYRDGERTLLDIQPVIPLPEAEEYQVRTKVKAQREKEGKATNSLRHERRYRFWADLISQCQGKTSLHANLKPGIYNWIGTASGVRGLGLHYSVRQHDSAIELYIDRGKDASHENLIIFKFLSSKRTPIETEFGYPLEWEELSEKRACRVRSRLQEGGWQDEPTTWQALHATMIERMIRFESVLRPYLDQIQSMDFANP